jgi:hypothetical protein
LSPDQAQAERISRIVKAQLPKGTGFILMVASPGDAGTMSWASKNIDGDDGIRLILEWLDRQQHSSQVHGEPTHETATALRESVFVMMCALAGKPPPMPEQAWGDFKKAWGAARLGTVDVTEHANACMELAAAALTELEFIQRQRGGRPIPPEPREWPKGDTKKTLVEDLLAKPASPNRDQLIEMARKGIFHDFESELLGPKLILYEMLMRFGYPDLACKARDGGYDDEPATVEQVEEMRSELGPEMWDAIMGEKERPKA